MVSEVVERCIGSTSSSTAGWLCVKLLLELFSIGVTTTTLMVDRELVSCVTVITTLSLRKVSAGDCWAGKESPD